MTESENDSVDKPVSEGDVKEVEVENTGDEGDGMVWFDNFVVFINGVDKGYTGKIKITSVGTDFGFAEPLDNN